MKSALPAHSLGSPNENHSADSSSAIEQPEEKKQRRLLRKQEKAARKARKKARARNRSERRGRSPSDKPKTGARKQRKPVTEEPANQTERLDSPEKTRGDNQKRKSKNARPRVAKQSRKAATTAPAAAAAWHTLVAPDSESRVPAAAKRKRPKQDELDAQDTLLEEVEDSRAIRPQRGLPRVIGTTISIGDDDSAVRLFAHLRTAFASAGFDLTHALGQADLAVVSGLQDPSHQGKHATVVLETIGDKGASTATIADAKTANAIFVPLVPKIDRHGAGEVLTHAGTLGEPGSALVAECIRNSVILVASGRVSPAPFSSAAPDFVEALHISEDVPRLLKSLHWAAKQLPKSLDIPFVPKDIEHFLDGSIVLPMEDESRALPFYLPFSWNLEVKGLAAQSRLYGLDFVTNVLSYWFLKANDVSSQRMEQIDAALKQREISASALLAGASAVILDCIQSTTHLPEHAWRLAYVQRRVRAFELFLLCCRMAVLRQIKFDSSVCQPVFQALIALLERLRPATLREIGTVAAVAENAVLIAAALPLRKIRFGEILLQDAIGSLGVHLKAGMSPDGVWQEGFQAHASVLGLLQVLGADLRAAEVSTRPFSGPLALLSRFADLLLTEGACPPIAEMPPVRLPQTARAAQIILRSLPKTLHKTSSDQAESQSRESGLFPSAGFFISRAPKAEKRPSSHLVLQARAPNRGGPSLCFSVGGKPLLIGGGTLERKAAPAIRKATRSEPVAHNAIKVNNSSYSDVRDTPDSVRIQGVWEDSNWSAAQLANDVFPEARMRRTVVHLKPVHSLLVVDELVTLAGGDATFKQAWHLAPGLQPYEGKRLCFVVPEDGVLSVAFEDEQHVQFAEGGTRLIGWTANAQRAVVPNPYLMRTMSAARAVLASLFCWGGAPIRPQVQVEVAAASWQVALAGEGPKARFAFEASELKRIA